MAAQPTNFVLKVYTAEADAIIGADATALKIIGNQVTATNIAVTEIDNTIVISGTIVGDVTDTFEVGDTVSIAGSTSNNGNHIIVSRTDAGFVVGTTTSDEGTHIGTFTFTNVSKTRAEINNEQQALEPFFTHERLFYRLESLTPSSEFYIDWDDGEDNTPEKANYSIKKFDLPTNVAIFEHTYTKHGKFFPMIRLTSPEGFKSKLYSPIESPRSSYRELEADVDLTGLVGQNKSQLALDSATNPRIPHLVPSNHPPIAILKTDRNQIMSGIDNSIVVESGISEATRRGYVYMDGRDLGIRHAAGIDGGVYVFEQSVEIIYETVNGEIVKEILSATTACSDDGRADPAPLNESIFPTEAVGAGLSKILSVKLIKLKENTYGDRSTFNTSYYNVKTDGLYPDERIWIRLVDSDDVSDSPNYHSFGGLADSVRELEGTTSYPCFCYVSNGNPYVSVNKSGHKVTADGSESRTRNSNVGIHRYYLYDDKLRRKTESGSAALRIGEIDINQFSNNYSTQVESNINAKKTLRYTHDHTRGQQLDDNQFNALKYNNTTLNGVGRFFDDNRLLRLQVEDTSVDGGSLATVVEPTDSMDRSFVECDYVDYMTADIRPDSLKHTSLLLFVNSTNVWKDLSTANLDNSKVVFGGDGSAKSSTANLKLTDIAGGSVDNRTPTNFLLVVKDRKFNKIFFRQDNDIAMRTMFLGGTIPHCKLTAYYNTPTGWKSLPIQDETAADYELETVGKATSLYQSGPVSWDLPDDWTAGAYNDILSGTWNVSSSGNDSSATEPKDLWTTANFPVAHKEGGGYAILIGIKSSNNFATNATIENFHTTVCDNQHSKIVKLVDPKHISLNQANGKKHMTQSVSFTRKGTYYQIKDRLGTSEIRKLGASGGTIKFGGVELGDGTSGAGTLARERLVKYQKQGTPVYWDVQHKNGTYTRFFGVVSSLSEDMATAGMFPKYAINMIVSHIAEFASDGTWTEGLISIGGEQGKAKSYLV